MEPKAGDLLWIDGRASVQFGGDRALIFRVTKVDEKATYAGWVWLRGYVLDRSGKAIEQRDIFVQLNGLRELVRRPNRRPAVRRPVRAIEAQPPRHQPQR